MATSLPKNLMDRITEAEARVASLYNACDERVDEAREELAALRSEASEVIRNANRGVKNEEEDSGKRYPLTGLTFNPQDERRRALARIAILEDEIADRQEEISALHRALDLSE